MDVNLESLKLLIREDTMPYFTFDQLKKLLEKNNNDVNAAAYEALILKSEDTTLQVSGLTLQDTSRYFLRLASLYRPSNTGILGGG